MYMYSMSTYGDWYGLRGAEQKNRNESAACVTQIGIGAVCCAQCAKTLEISNGIYFWFSNETGTAKDLAESVSEYRFNIE